VDRRSRSAMTDQYLNRRDQMFPQLTPAQIGRISGVGERRRVGSGEVLFELGEQNTRFFVVIEGAIEIVRPVDGREDPITVHGPGEFTGETNMLSARRSIVRGRARGDGAIVVVDREHLRALVQRDFELSEILMRAFILRRVALISHGGSGLVIQRIEDSSNVVLRARAQIDALEGTGRLERIRWRRLDTGESETRPIGHLFLMTGADPNTAWLDGSVVLDDKHFVKTGADLDPDELEEAGWPLARRPELMETSRPGVFAVGDVRSGSVKRVASAAGEGSVCMQLVHRALRGL